MLVLGSVIESHPILLEFPFFHSLNWDMFDGNSIPSACLQSEEVWFFKYSFIYDWWVDRDLGSKAAKITWGYLILQQTDPKTH